MEITKEDLKNMYHDLTLDQMMERLGVTRPTIYKLLKDNGIELKRKIKIKVVG